MPGEYTRRWDLPDLIRFMLGTGLLIGEALGVCWPDVDLDLRTLNVERTVIRVRGQGLKAKALKTRSSARVLVLPGRCVRLLETGRLARNVAEKVNLPRPIKHERRYLTHSQVEDLARACGYPADPSKHSSFDTRSNEMYRLVVLFLAYTGVRFGEMAALEVKRIDLTRRRAVIVESVTPVQGKGLVWGTPKSNQRREVSIPSFLVNDLAARVDGREPDDLVFGGIRNDQPLRVSTFRTAFSAAAASIGVPDLHPHELRHTAARLAIASGADVKVVQKMLGHASATMTLDTYGHLFEDRHDEVAAAMDAARGVRRAKRAEAATAANTLPAVANLLPTAPEARKWRRGPSPRFRRSGPLLTCVPPTGFEPALPP